MLHDVGAGLGDRELHVVDVLVLHPERPQGLRREPTHDRHAAALPRQAQGQVEVRRRVGRRRRHGGPLMGLARALSSSAGSSRTCRWQPASPSAMVSSRTTGRVTVHAGADLPRQSGGHVAQRGRVCHAGRERTGRHGHLDDAVVERRRACASLPSAPCSSWIRAAARSAVVGSSLSSGGLGEDRGGETRGLGGRDRRVRLPGGDERHRDAGGAVASRIDVDEGRRRRTGAEDLLHAPFDGAAPADSTGSPTRAARAPAAPPRPVPRSRRRRAAPRPRTTGASSSLGRALVQSSCNRQGLSCGARTPRAPSPRHGHLVEGRTDRAPAAQHAAAGGADERQDVGGRRRVRRR